VIFYDRQGGKAGAMQQCRSCRGSGMKVTMRPLGPGMVQQMQSVCTDCSGEGWIIDTFVKFYFIFLIYYCTLLMHSADYAVTRCPPVCPSHACIVLKRLTYQTPFTIG